MFSSFFKFNCNCLVCTEHVIVSRSINENVGYGFRELMISSIGKNVEDYSTPYYMSSA